VPPHRRRSKPFNLRVADGRAADDPTAHDLAILRSVHACLRPGARFRLGAANGYRAIRGYTQADVASGRFDPATMIQEHELAWTGPDGTERRAKVRHRPYLPPEIAALMGRAGFRVEHVWGGTRGRDEVGLDDYIVTIVARRPR
jgi:hypothetical protein